MTFIGITVQKVNSSTTGSQKFPSGIGVGVFNVASVVRWGYGMARCILYALLILLHFPSLPFMCRGF